MTRIEQRKQPYDVYGEHCLRCGAILYNTNRREWLFHAEGEHGYTAKTLETIAAKIRELEGEDET